jgi:hypothetical protein
MDLKGHIAEAHGEEMSRDRGGARGRVSNTETMEGTVEGARADNTTEIETPLSSNPQTCVDGSSAQD